MLMKLHVCVNYSPCGIEFAKNGSSGGQHAHLATVAYAMQPMTQSDRDNGYLRTRLLLILMFSTRTCRCLGYELVHARAM